MRDEFDDILRFWIDRGDRRLPHRRRARDRQGPRAARQPAARPRTTSTTSAGSASACEYSINRPEVHDVFRRWRALGRPATRGRAASARRTCSTSSSSCRFYGDGPTSCTSRSTSCSCTRDLEAAQLRADRRARPRRCCPSDAWPVWTAGQPRRRRASRRAGPRGDPARARVRADAAADAARHAGPLLRRRDRRCPTAEIAPERMRRSGRPARRPRAPGPRRRAHADAVDRRAGRGLHRRPAPSRGCRSATSPASTSPPSARTPARRCTSTRDLIALRRAEDDLRAGAYAEARGAGRRCGPTGAATASLVALNLGPDAASLPGRRHDRDRHPPPARRRGDRGVAAAGARRGRGPAPGAEWLHAGWRAEQHHRGERAAAAPARLAAAGSNRPDSSVSEVIDSVRPRRPRAPAAGTLLPSMMQFRSPRTTRC